MAANIQRFLTPNPVHLIPGLYGNKLQKRTCASWSHAWSSRTFLIGNFKWTPLKGCNDPAKESQQDVILPFSETQFAHVGTEVSAEQLFSPIVAL